MHIIGCLFIDCLFIIPEEKADESDDDKANAEKKKYDHYKKYAQSMQGDMKEQAAIRLQG